MNPVYTILLILLAVGLVFLGAVGGMVLYTGHCPACETLSEDD
jgi:hypothetical protein